MEHMWNTRSTHGYKEKDTLMERTTTRTLFHIIIVCFIFQRTDKWGVSRGLFNQNMSLANDCIETDKGSHWKIREVKEDLLYKTVIQTSSQVGNVFELVPKHTIKTLNNGWNQWTFRIDRIREWKTDFYHKIHEISVGFNQNNAFSNEFHIIAISKNNQPVYGNSNRKLFKYFAFTCVIVFSLLTLSIKRTNIENEVETVVSNGIRFNKVSTKHDSLWNIVSEFCIFKSSRYWNVKSDKQMDKSEPNSFLNGITTNNDNLCDVLFGFRGTPAISISAYPSSLDKYFNDISKTDATKSDLMKYEWARYESFKDFPKTSLMMPMRLAQDGFYYNGLGEEVTCFSCGIRYSNWSLEETAHQVHKRVSPKCKFICGEDNKNVSIHDSEFKRESTEHNSNDERNKDKFEDGATGGPCDTNASTVKTAVNSKSEHTNSTQSAIPNTRENVPQTETSISPTQQTSTGHKYRSPGLDGTNDANGTSRNYENTTANCMRTHQLSQSSINYDSAKHPDYAIKATRTASYIGWPSHHVQQPEELADAGFYYAGFQDCVRCFFCGGGLKNWVYGDSPWIEHARWYPNCAYLRHCKGEEFIRMYREAEFENEEETEETGILQGNPLTNWEPQVMTNVAHMTVPNTNTNTIDTDIDSAAAESVREMGYSREAVQDAIQIYRTYHGNRPLTAEAIMEIVLDDNQHRNHNGKASGNGNASGYGNASENGNASGNGKESGNGNASGNEKASGNGNASGNEKASGNGNTSPGCISTQPMLDVITSEREEEISQSQKEEKAPPSRCNLPSKADLKSLAEENRSLREQMMCKICMDKDACIVFLPCGHMVACSDCAPALRKCAICRTLIKGTIRAFPS